MNFKNGDEVVIIVNRPNGGCMKIGDIGIVRRSADSEDSDVDRAVEFKDDFLGMHDCEGTVPSGKGWFINTDDMELRKNSSGTLNQQKKEVLQALRDLWKVKDTPLTDKQAQDKFVVEGRVKEILKKYEKEK